MTEQTGAATISTSTHTVEVEVLNGTNLTQLVPTIEISEGASINPLGGGMTDFSSDVVYTVTAEDNVTTQDWTVTVTEAVQPELAWDPIVLNFTVPEGGSTDAQTATLTADAAAPINLSFATDPEAEWLILPTAETGLLSFDINPFDINNVPLSPGDYQTTLFATADNYASAALVINLTVEAAATDPCPPISLLECADIPLSLPVQLNFTGNEGGLADKDGLEIGMTMVDTHSEDRLVEDGPPSFPNVNGYEPSKLDIENDNLVVTATKGIAYLDPPNSSNNNTQLNSLGVGLQNLNAPFSIETKLLGISTGGSAAQAGIWYGIDEDNFVKLNVNGNNVEMRREIGGLSAGGVNTPDQIQLAGLGVAGEDVKLRLLIDPIANTITAFYTINDGNEVQLTKTNFDNLALPGVYLAGKDLDNETTGVSFAGVYATYRNGSVYNATFDYFSVKEEPLPTPVLSFNETNLSSTLTLGSNSETLTNTLNTTDDSQPTVDLTVDYGTGPQDWLTVPATVDLTTAATFDVTFDASSLAVGTYTATIMANALDYLEGSFTAQLVVEDDNTTNVAININFQDEGTTPPQDYLADFGEAYGDRGNGQTYGWITTDTGNPVSLVGQGRNRSTSQSDLRLSTVIHMEHPSTPPTGYWEIALPNGDYSVTVAAGDPAAGGDPEIHHVNAEGVNIIDTYTPTGAVGADTRHTTGTATVTVSDGKLTLDYSGGGINTKLNYVLIEPVNVSPALSFDTDQLNFNTLEGQAANSQSVELSANIGSPGAINLTYVPEAAWLVVPASVALGELSFGIDVNGLSVGTYETTVTASAQGFTSAAFTITLRISAQQIPAITGVTPADNSTDVSTNVSISANELFLPNPDPNGVFGVDNTTISSTTVKLIKVSSNTQVPASVNGTGGGDAINLTPTVALEENTEYRFEVNGVTDLVGIAFDPFTSTFTTGGNTVCCDGDLDQVAFNKVGQVATGKYTTLTIGPDGKLYGLTIGGEVHRWDMDTDGTLINKETITTLNDTYGARSAIGLTFDPDATANNLIAYISHCSGGLSDAPEWDGNISRLTGANLQNEDLIVTKLPRSKRDHLTNSIAFKPGQNNVLYFNQGSNSAGGAPDNAWGNRPERLLSAAVLRLDLDKLPESAWPLDAQTTMDQTAINTVSTSSPTLDGQYNPYYNDAPLTLYATGVRNAYDLVWHSNGQLYVPTNGTAGGSNAPASVDGTRRPDGSFYDHSIYPVVPAANGNNTQRDWLFRIDPSSALGYYGHPNPFRGEFVLNRGDVDVNNYPNGTAPDPNYRGAAFDFEFNKSPNGVIEYRSNAENGNLQGTILVARYSGGSDIIALLPDGPNGDVSTAKVGIPGFTGFSDPLDLVEDITTGNIYVSDYNGGGQIILLTPSNQSSPTPIIAATPAEVITEDIAGNNVATGEVTIFISNTGNGVLSNIDFSITGTDAAEFELEDAGFPNSLNPNASGTVAVALNAVNVGPKSAILTITGDAADAFVVDLNGLGKAGTGGSNEPSLQYILDTYEIAVDAGDEDPSSNTFNLPNGSTYNSLLGDEVDIQQFERAVDAPVTLEVLAVYGPESANPIVAFGWYESGNAGSTNEVFTVNNDVSGNGQTLNPVVTGPLLFDPGTASFGFYNRWPFFSNRILYSEDALNTFNNAIPHHVRVYPVPGEENAYIIATEEHISGFDYQDIVVIARNIKPADTIDPPVGDDIQINFSDAATPAPAGYNKDFGESYGARTAELTYGWVSTNGSTPLSIVGNGRNRPPDNPDVDVLTETLMHMQYDDVAGNNGVLAEGIWEIALANGTYQVTVGVGDASNESFAGTTHVINAEGTNIINYVAAQGTGNFQEAEATVTVEDGKLTLDAIGGTNTKINYVIISPTTVEPPVAAIRINAGGTSAYTDAQNNTWELDEPYLTGASEVQSKTFDVAGTDEDDLYLEYRFANDDDSSPGADFGYDIPVTGSGPFTVRLHFLEPFFGVPGGSGANQGGPGQRVFNVNIENGQGSLTNYDLNVETTPGTLIIETFNDVTVDDGVLSINFSSITNNAIISAIEVIGGEVQELPYFTGVTPADGATNVAINGFQITVGIVTPTGYELDEQTLAGNVKLFKVVNGVETEVPSNANDTGGGDAITLTPTQPLTEFSDYIFRIDGVEANLLNDINDRLPFIAFESTFSTGQSDNTPPVDLSGVSFTPVMGDDLGEGVDDIRFTSMAIGPDGKLYASTLGESIQRWDINSNDGTLSNLEVLNVNLTGSNHPETGVGAPDDRLIIGFTFAPEATAENLVAYVTHSALTLTGGPEWDGKLTRLSGPNLATVEDVLIHLPRSQKDHLTNSVIVGPGGDLFINQGSNTAGGAPDAAWGFRPERLLAAAVLKVELDKLPGSLPLSLYTTDDISVINAAPSNSIAMSDGTYNPYANNSPVTLYATGTRNAYDLVWHTNGHLYVPTNGTAGNNNGNPAQGSPVTPASADYVNEDPAGVRRPDGTFFTDATIPGVVGGETQKDWLFKASKNTYHGHPNPLRGEFVLNHGGITYDGLPGQTNPHVDVAKYPDNLGPDPAYVEPAFDFGFNKSPNGAIEYRSNAFDGVMKGLLLVTRFSGQDDIIVLQPGQVTGDIVQAYENVPGLQGLDDPLEVIEDVTTGNLYVAQYDRGGNQNQKIILLRANVQATLVAELTTDPEELIFEAVDQTSNEGNATDEKTIVVSNTGTAPLSITSVAVNDPFGNQYQVDGDSPTTLQPGESESYTLTWNPLDNGQNIGYQEAELEIVSDDPENPTTTIGLHGLKKSGYEGGQEPPLQDVVDALGIGINVGWTSLASNTNPAPMGEEVNVPLFVQSNSNPVEIRPVGRYSPSESLPFGWYTNIDGTVTTNELGVLSDGLANAQTLFPPIDGNSDGLVSFNSQGLFFGIYTESNTFNRTNYTEDGLNTGGVAHRVRVYPVKSRTGELIPNNFLICFEDASNGDYQDYMFVISNVEPYDQSSLVLSFDPAQLNFLAGVSGDPTTQTTTLSASGTLDASNVELVASESWVVLPNTTTLGNPMAFGVDVSGLDQGAYTATVTASAPGYLPAVLSINLSITDEIVWTYQFNYQPEGTFNIPSDYIPDTGAPFGLQQVGGQSLEFGWVLPGTTTPTSSTDNTRDRNVGGVSDLLNTLNIIAHTSANNFPPRDWMISLPNGPYYVNVSVGDPGTDDNSRHVVSVNGVTIVDFDEDANAPAIHTAEGTELVEVTDGFLRLTQGPLGDNTKVNYVRIAPFDPSLVPPTVQAEFTGNQSGEGVYRGTVEVALSAIDNGGSGIKEIRYAIDGGQEEVYTSSFNLTLPSGQSSFDYTIDVSAEDNNGNIGTATYNITLEEASGALIAIENMTKVPGTNRGFPADDYYTFHHLRNEGPAKTHNSNDMQIYNTGTSDLIITSFDRSGGAATDFIFTLPGDVTEVSPSNPLVIQPGNSVTMTWTFIGDTGNGGNGMFLETLDIISNADNAQDAQATMHGGFSPQPEGGDEINAQEVFDAFGFQSSMLSIVNDDGTITPPNNIPFRPSSNFPDPDNIDAGYEGDMILASSFVQADPSKPVIGIQLSALHGGPGSNGARLVEVNGNGTVGSVNFSHGPAWYQTLLPKESDNSDVINFGQAATINDPFRIAVANYLNTGGNNINGNRPDLLGCRIYKVIDHNGNLIPNEYIVLQDFVQGGCGAGSANCDWNDNTFYFINIRPEAVPTASDIDDAVATVDVDFEYDISTFFDKGYPGNVLTYTATGGPTWLNLNPSTGLFTGVAPANSAPSYEITVAATDLNGLTAGGSFTLTVLGTANEIPIADAQDVSTDEDIPLAITLTGSDNDEDPLTFVVTVDPANGTLSGTAPDLVYTPDPDFNGTDSFSFVTNDGKDNSEPAIVAITVLPINDDPSFELVNTSTVNDGFEAQTLTTWAFNADDGDPELDQGLTFSISAVDESLFEVIPAINADGDVSYDPIDDLEGSTDITITLTDELGAFFSLTFTLTLDYDGTVDLDNDGFDNTVDCDDTNPLIHPNATEICDGVDNNCDGNIDEGGVCDALAIRINAGGPEITYDDKVFDADIYFEGGKSYTNSSANVPDLFQTERSSESQEFSYNIPLQAGNYLVRLHFAEIYFGATGGGTGGTGQRIFDVTMEGNQIIDNYDINADVGTETPTFQDFNVTVTDGTLNLFFSATAAVGGVNQPKLSALEIISTDVVADSDNDGVLDNVDNCPDIPNSDQADLDNDGLGDLCDADIDGDGVPNIDDCAPEDPAISTEVLYYADADEDGFGDPNVSQLSCEPIEGYVLDNTDNCPAVANADQADLDNDGIGDVCDTDADGDGFTNDVDCEDLDPNSFPGAEEICDGVDNNCDGFVDEEGICDIVAIRINAGGPQVEYDNKTFDEDIYFEGGQSFTNAQAAVPDLFQTERSSPTQEFSYNIPVPAGSYLVRLHFAEIWFGAMGGGAAGTGQRIFDVTMEGNQIIDNYDINVDVGTETPTFQDFNVTVTDGTLNLFFSATAEVGGVNQPKLSAIEVINTDVVVDADQDGIADHLDNCPDIPNADQADLDNDGIGDVCDADIDGDDVPNVDDCAPEDPAISTEVLYYADADNDGFGDPNESQLSCGPLEGYVLDNTDNCPTTTNVDQGDLDNDGIGDVCDPDADGDGFTNDVDCDDFDASINPDASEICDGIDNNCVGGVDEGNVCDVLAIRINAGGPQVDYDNKTFDADLYFEGGKSYTNTSANVPSLFQTERSSESQEFNYNIPLPAGNYLVRLHFAEIYFGATGGGPGGTGQRIFDVTMEGNQIIDDYDINADVGTETPTFQDFNVTVTDGTLNLFFSATSAVGGVNQPKLSALEVISTDIIADADNDGVADEDDNCPDTPNADQADLDNDGEGDVCDADIDGDDVPNVDDCAPEDPAVTTETLYYADTDEDGFGDPNESQLSCGPLEGYVLDNTDNCPTTSNEDQADLDNDGIGDVCDPDADGDGFTSDVDCDDLNAAINPDATDIPDNGIDEDCDGSDATTGSDTVFWLEAECATVGSNWNVVENASEASNDAYVTIQSGNNSLIIPPADVPENQIQFTLNLANGEAGAYHLFARILAPGGNDDSFWVRVNGGSWIQWWQGLQTGPAFDWKEVLNSPFNLSVGLNTIDFAYREDGTLLDKLYLSTDAAAPVNIGPEGVNCTPENELPIAAFTANPLTGTAPLTVDFDASASSDPDGSIASYSWDFDGATSSVATPETSYTFTEPGTYQVSLIVFDNQGAASTNSATATIVVSPVVPTDSDDDGVPDTIDNCPTTPNADQADLDNDGTGDVCDPDADGDGFTKDVDCDDFNAAINPDAPEICDGIDNNCNGESDEGGVCEVLAIRINAGGPQVDYDNKTFDADTYFEDGKSYTNTSANVPTLFQTERSSLSQEFGYNIPLPAGNYLVRLHFAEIYFGANGGGPGGTGQRIFDVTMEGNQIINDYDIIADVGTETPTFQDFNVTVTDGTLNLFFSATSAVGGVDQPKLSALEVISTDAITDVDNDGVADEVDNCPTAPNADQADLDNDGLGDVCDTDIDGDGVPNVDDCAPADPSISTETLYYADADNDGLGDPNVSQLSCGPLAGYVLDNTDNCPSTNNPDQADLDGDGIGDACDPDADGDGFTSDVDCDDLNDSINPDATDIPDNGIDENCDGSDASTGTNTVFWLEAECAVVGGNWDIIQAPNSGVSNDAYVAIQPGNNTLFFPPADIPANQVRFELDLDSEDAGDYHLFAHIDAPTNSDNSFWVRVNGGSWLQWWEGLNTSGGFDWREVLNSPFSLSAGTNTIDFAYREDGTLLDKIYLSTDSATPTSLGPEGVNCNDTNAAPIAAFSADPLTGTVPLTVSFDASTSSDSDGSVVTYSWNFDPATSITTSAQTSFTFTEPGTYQVSLVVTDNDGATSTNNATTTIVVNPVAPTDSDEDGVVDAIDNCPNTPNADQADLDNDGLGNVCDNDIDGDGVLNGDDCAPEDPSLSTETLYYADADNDGLGDPNVSQLSCGPLAGYVLDNTDNCPSTNNPDQADLDGDGIGDACDPDADGDGFTSDVDCDDLNDSINPDATDIPDNGIDEDCDGSDASSGTNTVFWLEAECAVVGGNWDIIQAPNSGVSNDAYVAIQSGNNSLMFPPADIPANQVQFSLNLGSGDAGNYHLFAHIDAPSNSDNSFWVRVNGGIWIQWWQGLNTSGGFEWKEVLNSPFNLSLGTNTIDFAYREDGTLLDKIYLSTDPASPTNLGPEATNCDDSNAAPIAVFNADPLSGTAPLTVNFDASPSSDSDGTIVSYSWDFDPTTSTTTNPQTSHTFSQPGTYQVSLAVTDNDGATSNNTATVTIVVNPVGPADTDEDGVPDSVDNCPTTPNADQEDLDNDGIGDLCDTDADGDGFTSDVDCDDFNPAINPGAPEVCDGIDNNCNSQTDEGGVCDSDCTYQLVNFNNFDAAWGIWNDGGSDCRRSANDASFAFGETGRPVRLRDNTNTSVMTTDDLDLSLYSELKVNFTYLTISMDNALEDFWLQVSTDGGVTFTTVEEWNFGDEFENDVRYFDEVLIPGPFSPTTQLRFRCDASGNQDWVYIDNVEISGCANLNALTQSVVTQRETKKEQVSSTLPILRETTEVEDQRTTTVSESLELFPNPARNILHVQYTLTDRSDVRLIITDAQGRQVNQAEYKNQLGSIEHQFEVQNYAGGVYWLHLLTPKGRRVQKFVIIK